MSMAMGWNGEGRLLRTQAGAALAAEVSDAGPHAAGLVAGVLDALSCAPVGTRRMDDAEAGALLETYLRGMAAAAMIADAVNAEREFTGVRDFSVLGELARLLPEGQVTLGMVSLALAAVSRGAEVMEELALHRATAPVPEGHYAACAALGEAVRRAARYRLGAARRAG